MPKSKNKIAPEPTQEQSSSTTVSDQETESQVISLPAGPHISFIDVSGESYQCVFRKDVHYVYDAAKVNEPTFASHYIAAAVRDNLEQASHLCINSTTAMSMAELKQVLEQAVNHALSHKNGCLYLDLIGANQADITARDYAFMLEEVFFSLPISQLEKLIITVPVNGKNYSEHAEIESHLRKALLMHRLRRPIYEKLKLDVNDEPTLQQVDFLLETLLGSDWLGRLEFFNQRLKGLENSLELTASDFAINNFIKSCKEVETLLPALIKPICQVEDGKVLGFIDEFLQVLKRGAIQTESNLFKKDNNSDDGFLENMKDHSRVGPVQIHRVQLVSDDIQAAIYQLAIDNPEKADAILAIKLATMGNVEEVIMDVAAEKIFPRHIIVHSANGQCSAGGHWTRISLVLTKLANGTDKLCVTHVDSFGSGNASFLKPILMKAFPKASFPNITKKVVKPCGTGDQEDPWTCGYHALMGVLRGIVPENRSHPRYQNFTEEELCGLDLNTDEGGVPSSNLRHDGVQRTAKITNWLFQLIFGMSYAQHCQDYQAENAKRRTKRRMPDFGPRDKQASTEPLSPLGSGKTDQTPMAKKKHESIGNIDKLSLNVIRQNKKRQLHVKLNIKRQQLLAQLQRLNEQLDVRDKAALSQNHLFEFPATFEEVRKQFKLIESGMVSNPDLEPMERQALLKPLEDLFNELPDKILAVKAAMPDISCDSTELGSPIHSTNEQNHNPLVDAQSLKEDKVFEKVIEQVKVVPLSKYETMRYERIMQGALNAAIDKTKDLKPGRLNTVTGGEQKIKKIIDAIAEIDKQVLTELLDTCVGSEKGNATSNAQKYKLLKQKYENIEGRKLQDPAYVLTAQEQWIANCFSRINHKAKHPTVHYNDSDRRRALLNAFDDPNSNLYQAINHKRQSFFGISCTFFSGSGWHDIFNGDSQLLKDMKAADRTCDDSKPIAEIELVESTQVCQQV